MKKNTALRARKNKKDKMNIEGVKQKRFYQAYLLKWFY